MTDVGLVLGAGGVVGQAYHAGVLSALHEASGMGSPFGRHHRRIVGRIDHGHHAPTRRRGDGPRRHGHALTAVGEWREAGRPHPSELIGSPRAHSGVLVQTVAPAIARAPVEDCQAAVELPSGRGRHDHAPGRQDRPLRAGRSAPSLRRRPVA